MINSFSERKLKIYSEEYYSLLKDFCKNKALCRCEGWLCTFRVAWDSSSISYLADRIVNENGKSGEVVTVSNVYREEDEKYCDESEYIDIMVKHLKVKSFRGAPENKDALLINDRCLWHEENCYEKFNVQALNTYSVCKMNGIKVALDGQGADEQLAGYKRFWYSYFYARFQVQD